MAGWVLYSGEALIKAADTDKDGRISYKEWLMLKVKLVEAHLASTTRNGSCSRWGDKGTVDN
eukprot:CAMPEP_0198704156 /NCGR_PEP_ID=MMETSP1468-20131203/389754_1 /TAXON_ID=1461545 /ORGANISM="Mantoniella sp, Strain CCMP1436" /LENGTH=61 /DNA_ID=CAMNT_0044462953 /DNA_START=506 /DNA_END=691 /DNA_ORIENTATION=+